MIWLWTGLVLVVSLPVTLAVWGLILHYYIRWRYLHHMVRIFQEKPLFIVPKGQPVPGAEDVSFQTADGLTLRGCYLKTSAAARRGVILFGPEFGSNRWACFQYCERLIEAGYDVFSFEMRGQGESPIQPGYDPLHWVTSHEIEDARAALAYLKSRPDASPNGIGLFGISKGGGAGLMAAAQDPCIRCCVTDGIFGTFSTVFPYMRRWYAIYNPHYMLHGIIPLWFYGTIGKAGLRQIARERHCDFPSLEKMMAKLAPRPLLMIHGGGDTYIKPEMAYGLYQRARQPKEFWLVEKAKHNQAHQVAKDEYQRRVQEFFDRHLAEPVPQPLKVPDPEPSSPALAQTA